jgi:hypothetical protein
MSNEPDKVLVTGALGAYVLTGLLWMNGNGFAEELPLTRNAPIDQFQNRQEDIKPYDFNAPPAGIFRTITVAEDFEEELGFRQQNEIVPVKPTGEFPTGAKPVFIVFQLYQHFQSFEIFSLCYPEAVPGLDPKTVVARDTIYIATEDESGYLKLLPPAEGWKPGHYKVEIHVGEEANNLSLVGTMRFGVAARASSNERGKANPMANNSRGGFVE